jgi:hypothetical protein
MIPAPQQFQKAIEAFDQANSQDPNQKELLYAQRMTHWLERLEPEASEVLRLAARSQHICRWMIPRSQYPVGRTGYLKWRTTLYEFHAQKAGEILEKIGYDRQTIAQVQELLRKKDIKTNPQMQLLEDVICMVFLENYFAEFAQKHPEEKIISIVQKTWKKMSPTGQKAALTLPMSDEVRALIQKALS